MHVKFCFCTFLKTGGGGGARRAGGWRSDTVISEAVVPVSMDVIDLKY